MLNDQLVVATHRVDWVASRSDILHQTVLSALVGRSGRDRHAITVEVWAATEARPHPMPDKYPPLKAQPARVSGGRTYCGSQRGFSAAHSFSTTAEVTCERCLASAPFSVESLPTDVVTERMGRLVPVL